MTETTDPVAALLADDVMEIVNRYRPGSSSADQMTREIRAAAENWARTAAPDGPDPELITWLAILLHQANLAALRGGLGAEAQAARMALCRLLGIRETAMPLAGIASRLRAALTVRDSPRSTREGDTR